MLSLSDFNQVAVVEVFNSTSIYQGIAKKRHRKISEMTSELQPSITGSLHLMQRNLRHIQRN